MVGRRRSALALVALLGVTATSAAAPTAAPPTPTSYDPLRVDPRARPAPFDLTVDDRSRRRQLPVRVYLPAAPAPAPVVLFSHGLGGSREGSAYLGEHWAARGYAAVFLQHPGSDSEVWEGVRMARRRSALRRAAGPRNFLARVKDVPAVLDQLKHWNRSATGPLAGRLDLDRVGMSGHSFGAITTQAVSGQSMGRGKRPFTDRRIKAAIVMSPSSPRFGGPEKAFSGVKLPWLLMTGTRDVAEIGNIDMESRLAVYPALPPGGKYELVLHDGQHSAFTERALPGDTVPRNPNHHRVILALSTAFWDAWLRDDAAARAWLDGDGPASVLEGRDRWRRK